MDLEPTGDRLTDLSRVLAMIAGVSPAPRPGQRFGNYHALVLALGKPYPGAPRPKGVRKQRQRLCYRNALHLALSRAGWRYVEGYADAGLGLPLSHAWAIDEQGRVVDPTWKAPAEAAYYGVAFAPEDAAAAMARRGYYGLFENDYLDDFALLKTGALPREK